MKVNKQVCVYFLAFDYLLLDFQHRNLKFSSRNCHHRVLGQIYVQVKYEVNMLGLKKSLSMCLLLTKYTIFLSRPSNTFL